MQIFNALQTRDQWLHQWVCFNVVRPINMRRTWPDPSRIATINDARANPSA